jgi:hypothetical protein
MFATDTVGILGTFDVGIEVESDSAVSAGHATSLVDRVRDRAQSDPISGRDRYYIALAQLSLGIAGM